MVEMNDSNTKNFAETNSDSKSDDVLDIHYDTSHSNDINFDNISLSGGMSPFLRPNNSDWKLLDINTSNANNSISDIPITPLINEPQTAQESLKPIGNPVSDKNMIVEEPSPENEHKETYSQPNLMELEKNYFVKNPSATDLREVVLKKMKKSNDSVLKKPRPAFINKVWLMVNDESTDDCICWASDGESFIITHQIDFVTKVLPKYFKHCKIASFIRQLNMYGWKKVQDARSGGLNDPNEEKLQFYNEHFLKGQPDLLDFINRQKPHSQTSHAVNKNGKENVGHDSLHENIRNRNVNSGIAENMSSTSTANPPGLSWKMPQYIPFAANNMNHINLIEAPSKATETTKNNAVAVVHPSSNISKTQLGGLDTSVLLQEFETLKYNQLSMAEDLKRLAKQNDVLWKQNIDTRKRLQKQENALEQILKFMSNYFGPGVQRLIQQDIAASSNASNGNEDSASTTKMRKSQPSSSKIVNIDTPSKSKSRTNSTSIKINTGNGKTAQIQEILDDDLIDSPNHNMNAPIIDELSPLQTTNPSSAKNVMNSPTIQSIDSNNSPELVNPVMENFTSNNPRGLIETPRFDFNSEHTPLSDSNVYKPYATKTNIPISRDSFPSFSASADENNNLSILDDHNQYSEILSNLQENIKKQEEHLSGFSQILNKLQASDETQDIPQTSAANSPLIHPFDLNDYLSTTPNTPSMLGNNRQLNAITEKPTVEEIQDPVKSTDNKRKVSIFDLDDHEAEPSKKPKTR